MDKIKLQNNFEFAVEDGASLGNINHLAETESAALAVCQQLTDYNCSHVEFLHDGAVTGAYDDLVIIQPPVRLITEDGVLVSFGLREKTQTEKDIEALHAEQELQNEAIDFLAMGGME